MSSPVDFWNARYAAAEYAYGEAPNTFFAEQLAQIQPPGRILLIAEGEGRNAVHAATQGWHAMGVDISQVARQKALQLADHKQVSIDYAVCAVQHFDFAAYAPWDVVALIFAHFPPEVRQQAHRAAAAALRPGGRVILEAFHPRQLAWTAVSGGPSDPAMLYDTDLLRTDFEGMEIVLCTEQQLKLSEGSFHDGSAETVRFVAERAA